MMRHPNKDSKRSPSVEPPKGSKRKGTRSVSTLTPTQLARKRANDREAQRAIRMRTKEHIERLERELEELRSQQSRDEEVKYLTERNERLENELAMLRAQLGKPGGISTPQHYPSPVLQESLSGSPSGMPGRDYNSPISDYVAPYIPTSDPCEPWPSVVACSAVPSTGSTSPSSSANDEYGYMPAPTLPDGSRLPPTSVPMIESASVDYDDVERGPSGYPRGHGAPSAASYVQQQSWYPVYYSN